VIKVIIGITVSEAMAIDSLCRNEDISQELFLQIGQIILSGEPMKVTVSERDLWRIRDVVPHAHTIGKEPAGLTLKRKVYECLLNMDIERELGIPVSSVEEPRFKKQNLVEGTHPDYDRLRGDES